MKDFLSVAFWISAVVLALIVADFIRLAILRAIWNRRHARMAARLKRQAVINEQ